MISIDGKPQKLCLTLGALAQLETAFALNNLQELSTKLKALSAQDFLIILAILLEAGGNGFEIEALKKAKIDPHKCAIAIAKTFELAFKNDE